MEKVIELLLIAGYVEDGSTPQQTVRWATTKAPVYGRGCYGGGEVVTVGGRRRFTKGDRRVTVGKRTTCFYRVLQEEQPAPVLRRSTQQRVADMVNVPTKDLDAIRRNI